MLHSRCDCDLRAREFSGRRRTLSGELRWLSSSRLVAGLILALAVVIVAHAQPPKRVLMLHSWGPEFGDLYATDMRAQLGQQLPGGCELYDEWLIPGRFADGHGDAALTAYLNTLFEARPLDLVITLGAPAAHFVQLHGQSLFGDAPRLFADIEERRAPGPSLSANETAVPISVDLTAVVQNMLRVQPLTATIAVVIGNSQIEKYWEGQLAASVEPFKDRVRLTFLSGLPFSEVLQRVATLPAHSAILYLLLSQDIEGIPPNEDTAIAQLHAAAKAPMFSYTDAYLGKGIVGGPLISGREQARETARTAARLLAGEKAADIRVSPIGLSQPVFDWRELRRWHINESALPPASMILFREPSIWDRYRWQLAAVIAALLAMGALIVRLLYEHGRWRSAESNAQQRMVELSHMNRRSTVGELSASIAHELTQPLSAIGNNASVAVSVLENSSPDIGLLREISADIARDQRRAIEVIKRLRGLFAKSTSEAQTVDLNDVMQDVFELLAAHAFAHRVTLNMGRAPGTALVKGDRVQLQQVVLNVVMNAIEAIDGNAKGEREIIGSTLVDGQFATVSIEDTGPGLSSEDLEHIFEPFFTTKDAGMGMGLAIARSIVVSQGGRISAENRSVRGAVVRIAMPRVN
jgi:signal transduction histidine kinase